MTNKKFNVIAEMPVMSRSGYGNWSDQLAKLLIEYPRFATIILPCMWGANTVRQTEAPGDELIKKHIPKVKEIPAPHIYFNCTIPHLAQPQGTIWNCNFSAGLEVDKCPDAVMDGVNQWDLNIVLSNFAKQNYLNSNIKPTKPIETLMWANPDVYRPTTIHDSKVDSIMDMIIEDEVFLMIGQNTSPHLFLDRKNISNLIKDFCTVFNGKDKKPALLLKTNGINTSNYDRDTTIDRLKSAKASIPGTDVSVYLLHGELTDIELNALYNHPKIICNVSETRGEGWGGPLAEGALSGKPTIATNFSGHLEFLPPDYFIPLEGKLEEIPEMAVSEYYEKGSRWFEVNHELAQKVFSEFYYNEPFRTLANQKAKELAVINAKKFNLEAMRRDLYKILDKYLLGI